MKKAIVTGGAGFIGSHLAERLVELGHQVIIIDDLSSGKIENMDKLLSGKKAEFIQGSITDISLLKRLFKDADYVFHLAAVTSVPRSIDNPQASHEVNVNGTLNVLMAARDNSVRRLVLASSAAVYGDTPTLPQKENMTPRPLSPYAVAKLVGEYYCQVFTGIYNLPSVCLRYFNVYGPRQDVNSAYAAVIPRFIQDVRQGNAPVIFGDGEQTRDFAFVKDVVEANILAVQSDITGIFNIGGGESVTINRLAELIVELVGSHVKPIYREPRPGDIKYSLADISRARAFGFKPEYNLKQGLAETIRLLA